METEGKSMPDIRYEREGIEKIIGKFSIKDFIVYKELKKDDSFIVIMEKNSNPEDLV